MDKETQAELLSFLVVGQLLALARSGEWLRIDYLIGPCRLWMLSNGARGDWLERARLVEIAIVFAKEARTLAFPCDEAGLLKLFNLDGGWFLDYRSPVVQRIHALSVERLCAVS